MPRPCCLDHARSTTNCAVLVCCETHKFHERVQLDSITHNEVMDGGMLAQVSWLLGSMAQAFPCKAVALADGLLGRPHPLGSPPPPPLINCHSSPCHPLPPSPNRAQIQDRPDVPALQGPLAESPKVHLLNLAYDLMPADVVR